MSTTTTKAPSKTTDLVDLVSGAGPGASPSDLSDGLMGYGRTLAGIELRPVTLATLVLLERTKSAFMSQNTGNALQDEVFGTCCKFLALQSGTLKQARILAQRPELLEERALEIADQVNPKEARTLFTDIHSFLNDALGSQVVPEADREDPNLSSEGNS